MLYEVITDLHEDNQHLIKRLINDEPEMHIPTEPAVSTFEYATRRDEEIIQDTEEIVEESLSLEEKEKELITKALQKHRGKRKYAAQELGISERTLYRKIKEYNLMDM